VRALGRTAGSLGYDAPLIAAVETVNNRQKRTLFDKLAGELGELRGATIAVWGLAFKPNTDDMREAPSRTLIEALWGAGARVRAFDPAAHAEAGRLYGSRPDFVLAEDPYDALDEADALVICTEWQQFRAPDFDEMARRLKAKTIIDGRNLYAPERLWNAGWTYLSIGRSRGGK
jgi:UDPglucose 6-dehydrogenase